MKESSFSEKILNPLLSNIKRFTNQNAFHINGTFYTYNQLSDHISQIRKALKEYPQKSYIGLIANDDIETYASVFAVWLEGKCYVPLHPHQPLDRLNEIISEINIEVILNSMPDPKFESKKTINTRSLNYENEIAEYDTEFDDENLAYVLFTSGSTGKPKGVTITRKNVASFLDSFLNCGFQITEEDRCLQCFDLTFDVSVQNFLVPLLKGACIYTVPHDQIKYIYVSNLWEEHQLTFGAVAPSMLRYLRPYFQEIDLPWMRYCILTAEGSPLDLIKEWSNCIPNAQIFNFYGPTEATIYCTYCEIKRDKPNKSLNGMLSIGVPMKNVNAVIVDENNHILNEGEKGELCVSGDQIFPGYLNSPEKNRNAFFENEVNGIRSRYYRTGDLCYFDTDGFIMLYGRLDSQAKIQGYRVELGEIEFHTREFLNGKNAVVLVSLNKNGNNELVLFVENEDVDKSALVSYLNSKLPAYMIPSKIFLEKEFPLNANSKVDKVRLKQKMDLFVI
ncbi:MAG: amino acid adenylation domain-containing protein [Ginsengibacter sp.]